MSLPTLTSVPGMQFQTIPSGTKLPRAKSTRLPTMYELQTLDTLPMTDQRYCLDCLISTVEHLAKTSIKEALKEEEQKIEIQEATEQDIVTRLSVERERQALETEM